MERTIAVVEATLAARGEEVTIPSRGVVALVSKLPVTTSENQEMRSSVSDTKAQEEGEDNVWSLHPTLLR